MSREPFVPEKFFAELDALGYPEVGRLLASGRWGKVGQKYELVLEWRHQYQLSQASAAEAEQTKIAREAKDAAERSAVAAEDSAATSKRSAVASERSATAAERANVRAIIAVVVAVGSIIAQVILGYFKP